MKKLLYEIIGADDDEDAKEMAKILSIYLFIAKGYLMAIILILIIAFIVL